MKKIATYVIAMAITLSLSTVAAGRNGSRKEARHRRKEMYRQWYASVHTDKTTYWNPFWDFIVPHSYDGVANGKRLYYDKKGNPLSPQLFQIKDGMNDNNAWKTWKQLSEGTYYQQRKS